MLSQRSGASGAKIRRLVNKPNEATYCTLKCVVDALNDGLRGDLQIGSVFSLIDLASYPEVFCVSEIADLTPAACEHPPDVADETNFCTLLPPQSETEPLVAVGAQETIGGKVAEVIIPDEPRCQVLESRRAYLKMVMQLIPGSSIALICAFLAGEVAFRLGIPGQDGPDAFWIRFYQGLGCVACKSLSPQRIRLQTVIGWILINYCILGYLFGICFAYTLDQLFAIKTVANAVAAGLHTFAMIASAPFLESWLNRIAALESVAAAGRSVFSLAVR